MKILYFDKNGEKIEGETSLDESIIKLPVIIRYYATFDSYSLFIRPSNHRIKKINKTVKKNPEVYSMITGNYVCTNQHPEQLESWSLELDSYENANKQMFEWLDRYAIGTLRGWHQNYCVYNTMFLSNPDKQLNEEFYLTDIDLARGTNCTIHLYGKGIIDQRYLSNVLIFVNGEYEVV